MKYLIVSNEYSSRVILGKEKDLINILDTHITSVKRIKRAIDTAYQEYLYSSRRPASDFGITKTLEANERIAKVHSIYESAVDNLTNSYELFNYDMYLLEAITPEEFLNAQNKLDLLIDN